MQSNKNSKCIKHPNQKIVYFQVKGIENNRQGQNLFYCLECLDADETFNKKNYVLISKFIEQSEQFQINPEWPPMNDSTFLLNLVKSTVGEDDITTYEKQIESFFDQFRIELLEQLNVQQKNMLQMARNIFKTKAEFISKYQDISKIVELKQLLTDNLVDISQKENQYKALHQEMLSKQNQIIQDLNQFVNSNSNNNNSNISNNLLNVTKANQVKNQIISQIKDLNFFINNPNSNKNNNNNNNNNNINNNLNIIPNNQIQTYQNIINSFIKLDYGNFVFKTYCSLDNRNVYSRATKNNNTNEIEIISNNQNGWLYLASDTVLSQQNKYIFRLQISSLQQNQKIFIGFVGDKLRNKKYYNIAFGLVGQNNTQQMCLAPYYIINFNQIKGNGLILSKENIVEMRLCLKDQTLILMDYPLYNHQISLKQQYQQNFNQDDIRFYLGFNEQGIRVKLREAMIVNEFN